MSAAEAIRRCPHAVFVRPRHSLYREYSRHVWSTRARHRADGRADRARRGIPRHGRGRADFLEARVVAEAVQTAVRAATSLTCSLGVAPCKVVAKVASDARKPGGLTVVVPGQEASFLARFDVRRLPGVGPKAEAATARRRSRDGRRARGARRRRAAAAAAGQRRQRAARPRAGHRPARARARRRADLDQRREHVRARPRRARAPARRAARGWRSRSPNGCRRRGRSARTVTTKLRYADFSIRSRSTSLDVGIDDAEQIGDLACRLLDRGLRDRPGALRLVGVGVSGLVAVSPADDRASVLGSRASARRVGRGLLRLAGREHQETAERASGEHADAPPEPARLSTQPSAGRPRSGRGRSRRPRSRPSRSGGCTRSHCS